MSLFHSKLCKRDCPSILMVNVLVFLSIDWIAPSLSRPMGGKALAEAPVRKQHARAESFASLHTRI